MQLDYDEDMEAGLEGDWAYAEGQKLVRTGSTAENINFGRVLADADAKGFAKRLPCANVFKFTVDLVTGNVITGKVVVDGVETNVTYTFNTSHSASMTALAGIIANVPGVDTAVVDSADANGRTIVLKAEGKNVCYVKDIAVAGGAGQPVVNYGTIDKFSGISLFVHMQPDSNQETFYKKNKDAMNVVRHGAVLMSATDVNTDNDIYVSIVDTNTVKRGQITKSAGTPTTAVKWEGAKFIGSVTGTGLVPVTPAFLG